MKPDKLLYAVYEILCHGYGSQKWWPAETADEMIIGSILTQNTNWNNVIKAVSNLKKNNLCSLKAILCCETGHIASLIRPSGYFNIKAERLKAIAQALDDVNLSSWKTEQARSYLLNIKGVGEETADSILLYAYHKPVFVVDAYTVRLTDRLLPENKCSTYKQYRSLYMDNLPPETLIFNEYHALIVHHGKNVCKRRPVCSRCILAGVCPSRQLRS